jgi:hypothetical protein
MPMQRVTKLPLEDDGLLVEEGDHHASAGVPDVLAHRFLAVRQPHAVFDHLQQNPVVGDARSERGLGEIVNVG